MIAHEAKKETTDLAVTETIKGASLEDILSILDSAIGIDSFDRLATEEVLSRLNELEETVKPIGETLEKLKELRSTCRYFLRKKHLVERAELDVVLDHQDMYNRINLLSRDEKSLEERIEADSSADSILEFGGVDLLGIKMKEREWLLDPLLRQESSAMLYADAGVGKTYLSWEMIVTVAGGGEFADWTASKPRRVLVVDGEMNASELKGRFKSAIDRHPVEVASIAVKNITLIPRQAQHWKTKFYDLDKPEYQNMLLSRLNVAKEEGQPYELLVLDNFSCLADVEDENSSSAFNGICQFLNRAKTMTTVLLIHHTKKNSGARKVSDGGMTYRGSSKLGGIMEVCIGLSTPNNSEKPEHRGAAFKMTLEKFRGLPDERTDPRVFSLDPETDRWHIQASEDEKFAKYLDALRSYKYSSGSELAEGLEVNKSTVSRALVQMKADGVISELEIKQCYSTATNLSKSDEDVELMLESDF